MSEIDLVHRAARLARIRVEAGEAGADLERALAAFQSIARADTAGVEPLFAPERPASLPRDDRPALDRHAAELLERAPAVQDGWYVVPRVPGAEP